MMAPHLKVFSSHLETSNWTSDITSNKTSLDKNTLLNFGDICNTHGYLVAAKTYFEYALQITNDEVEGNNHDRINFIATVLNNVGVVYWKLGQFRLAEDHHQRALALLESLNPQNPTPEIADSLNKLGNVSYSLSQFEKAKDYFCRSLAMREEIFGEEDATVAASLNNLGSIHSVLGEHDIAKEYYQRSLDMAEKTYGKIHPHVANCLCNLGIVQSELGATKEAIRYHKQALEMRKELYFPEHILISESYNNLGLMHKGMGELEQAMDCYESALRIREKTLHLEHPAMAELLSNLGQLYMDLGEMQKSKDFHFRARYIWMKILESGHAELGDSMFNLGMVFEQCSELDEAVYHFQQARTIYAKSYPMSHPLCQSADESFKRVSQQQADLNNQTNSSARPDHFTARLGRSMARSVRGSKILNYPFSGAHWDRDIIYTGNRLPLISSTLDTIIISLVFVLMLHCVNYYVGNAEQGGLKIAWMVIPWYASLSVTFLKATIAEYIQDFSLLLELKILGFLYFLGYCFQSYL